jgi:hypothetical protein
MAGQAANNAALREAGTSNPAASSHAEPNGVAILNAEHKKGVAASDEDEKAKTDEVEQTADRLLKQTQQAPSAPVSRQTSQKP